MNKYNPITFGNDVNSVEIYESLENIRDTKRISINVKQYKDAYNYNTIDYYNSEEYKKSLLYQYEQFNIKFDEFRKAFFEASRFPKLAEKTYWFIHRVIRLKNRG